MAQYADDWVQNADLLFRGIAVPEILGQPVQEGRVFRMPAKDPDTLRGF